MNKIFINNKSLAIIIILLITFSIFYFIPNDKLNAQPPLPPDYNITVRISQNGPTSQFLAANTTNITLYNIVLYVSGTNTIRLTNLRLTTAGTYVTSDFLHNSIKLWYSTDGISLTSLLATQDIVASGQDIVFSGLSCTLKEQKYLIVTADIPDGNTTINGHNFNIIPTPIKNFTFAEPITKEGDINGNLGTPQLFIDTLIMPTNLYNTALYWSLTNSGTTRTLSIYLDGKNTQLVASGSIDGDGIINLIPMNNSGISASINVVYYSDDTDDSNVLVYSTLNVTSANNPNEIFAGGVITLVNTMTVDFKLLSPQSSEYFSGGTSNNIIYAVKLVGKYFGGNPVNLSSVTYTTRGTYNIADFKDNSFKLWYSASILSNGFLPASATLLGSHSIVGPENTIVFENLTQSVTGTGYLYFTTDVNIDCTNGNTIFIYQVPFSNFIFSGDIVPTGPNPINAGAYQTLESTNWVSISQSMTKSSLVNAGSKGITINKISIYPQPSTTVTLKSIKLLTSGTYQAGDVTNFKLYYSADGKTLTTNLPISVSNVYNFINKTGDTYNQLDIVSCSGPSIPNNTLYWTLSNSGSVRTLKLYSDYDTLNLVSTGSLSGDGILKFNAVNGSKITAVIKVLYKVDNLQKGNTITFSSTRSGEEIFFTGSQDFNTNTQYLILRTDITLEALNDHTIFISPTPLDNIIFAQTSLGKNINKTGYNPTIGGGVITIKGGVYVDFSFQGPTNPADVYAGTDNNVLYNILMKETDISSNRDATIKAIALNTNGTFAGNDIKPNGFKLYYTSTSTIDSYISPSPFIPSSISYNVTITDDSYNQITISSFTEKIFYSNKTLYWSLTNNGDLTTGTRTISLYSDVQKTLLVAEGTRTGDGIIEITENNASGIFATANIIYTQDDNHIRNTLDILPPVLNFNLNQILPNGASRYLILTVDIASSAKHNNTLNITITPHSNISFIDSITTVTKTGTNPISGAQAITLKNQLSIDISQAGPVNAFIDAPDSTHNVILYKLKFKVSNLNIPTEATLTGLSVRTAGTYLPDYFVPGSVKLWMSSNSSLINGFDFENPPGNATLLNITSIDMSITNDLLEFSSLNQPPNINPTLISGTKYIYITGDLNLTTDNTINLTTYNTPYTSMSQITFEEDVTKTGAVVITPPGDVAGILPGGTYTFRNPVTVDVDLSLNGPKTPGIFYGNSENNILYVIKLFNTNLTNSAKLNGLVLNTAGTFDINDFKPNGFKLWINTNPGLSGASLASPFVSGINLSGKQLIWTGLTESIPSNTVKYLIVTTEIAPTAVNLHNIYVTTTAFSNLSFSGNVFTVFTLPNSDPLGAGAVQTIQNGIIIDLSLQGPINSSNVIVGTPDKILYSIKIKHNDYTGQARNAVLTDLTLGTAGTYTTDDFSGKLKLWLNSNPDLTGNPILINSSYDIVASGNSINFTGLQQSIDANSIKYLILTADISNIAVNAHNINITSTPFTNIVFTGNGGVTKVYSGTNTDPLNAGAVITIQGCVWKINALSTDWNTASNWSIMTVPGIGSNVIIQAGENQPIIPKGTSVIISNLILQSGSNLTLSDSVSLKVTNNLIIKQGVNLILNDNRTLDLNNITIEGGGAFTYYGGNFIKTGTLQILSGLSGTGAFIDKSPSPGLNVNATVQRYIPGVSGYHYFSSPCYNIDFSQISDDIKGINWGAKFENGEISNLWKYDEANISTTNHGLQGTVLNGFESPGNAQEIMQPMQGYAGYFDHGSGAEIEGTLNSGDISISLTNTSSSIITDDGWNLIGNPYPSPVDWSLVNKNNAGSAVYLFTAANSSTPALSGYVGAYSAQINGIIPVMQSFFVYTANGGGSLSISNDARVNTINPKFYKKTKANTEPFLVLTGSLEGDNSRLDSTRIYFTENATNTFDLPFDAYKFMNNDGRPNIYSLALYDFLSINALPPLADTEVIVPLLYNVTEKGNYNLNVSKLANFIDGSNVFLEDKGTGQLNDLFTQPNYVFYTTPSDRPRFYLHFLNPYVSSNDIPKDENVKIFSSENNLYVVFNEDLNNKHVSFSLSVYNMLGQKIILDNTLTSKSNTIKLNISSGFYLAKLTSSNKVIVKKIFIKSAMREN